MKLNLEKHHRHRGDEVEDKTTLWVIHWLSLLITPSISITQCNLSPCNSSLLFFWAVSHRCYMLLLQHFGIASPHSLLNGSSLLKNLEKLTPFLAALKAAKLILQTSAGAWGYFPFLSAFSLLVIFSAARSPAFSLKPAFHFLPLKSSLFSLLSEKEKEKIKLSEYPFTNLQRINLSTKCQAPKLLTSKTCFYLHTEQQCIISQKNSERRELFATSAFPAVYTFFLLFPAWKFVYKKNFNIFLLK